MMSVIKPIKFTPAMLASTNAAESFLAWVSGTAYSTGAKVIYPDQTGLSRIWESLANSNTTAPAAAGQWANIGPANRHAMFDNLISTQTTAASPLVVELTPDDVVTSLGLLNLVGQSVRVEMIVNGQTVYDSSQSLQGAEIADWWDYYFKQDEQVTQAIFRDLPAYYAPRIRITLTGSPGGQVAIGHAVFGSAQDIGSLGLGAQSGIIDYSRKETDEFGETQFVQRAYADEFSGQVLISNGQLNSVKRLLRDLRATPSLWIGIEDDTYREPLVVFGWYRSHRVSINYPNHSLIDIEIEGLT